MSNKELSELIYRIEYFNEWRRGGDTAMPHPKQIGEDIDSAVELLKQQLKKEK